MSGTECPASFVTWAALSLHSHILGRKVWTYHGDMFKIKPNMGVCLVGTSGSGKSSAKDKIVKDVMSEYFPQYLTSADIQSYQHICKEMGTDEALFTWENGNGKIEEYRSFYSIIDELSLFLATDAAGMVNFLIGIYDTDYFGTGFKKDGGVKQRFRNPYFSLIACTIPDFIVTDLRMSFLTGGLARRMVIVHDEKTKFIAKPTKPKGGQEAFERAIQHLKSNELIKGQMKHTAKAELWWDEWYSHPEKRIVKDDPILFIIHENKHVILTKVAMLLALDDYNHTMTITDEHYALALELLDILEPKIQKLTSGVGRNEAAGIITLMENVIAQMGGAIAEKTLFSQFLRHLRWVDFVDAVDSLVRIDKLVKWEQAGKVWLATPNRYQQLLEEQKKKQKPSE